MRFEKTIEIAAPAQRVFDVYADVEHWPDWTASVTSVQRLDEGPLRVGSRARVRQPRLPVAVWEVTDLVPGRFFVWVARGPGLRATGSHVVEVTDHPGRVRATASLEQAGPLGLVMALATRRLTERYLTTEVEGLKRHAEG
jgi:uncharacterized membrane protein